MTRARWMQPEIGLVLLIPLLTVIGGLWTLHLADIDDSADGEAEGARHTAQVQTADVAPDQAAARLGLRAALRVDPACGCIRLRLSDPRAAGDGKLQLALVHRMYAARDTTLPLARDGAGWTSPRLPSGNTAWRLVLTNGVQATSPRAGGAPAWRLVGTLAPNARAAMLIPAFAAP